MKSQADGQIPGLTSPRYFCTNSEPTTRMKLAVVELATALTNMVFPVPASIDVGGRLAIARGRVRLRTIGEIARTRRTIEQNTSRRINSDLPIQVELDSPEDQ